MRHFRFLKETIFEKIGETFWKGADVIFFGRFKNFLELLRIEKLRGQSSVRKAFYKDRQLGEKKDD